MPKVSDPVVIGPRWQSRRELGLKTPLGSNDLQVKQCYNSMKRVSWTKNTYGGVYSLEYSPTGSVLTAASEKQSVLIYDPFNLSLEHTIENAHTDCVNFIKFLDTFTFATGSDDSTIALWDLRYPNRRLHELRGHENWVKSIDYSPKDKLLITSGFDGCVYTWDLYLNNEVGIKHTKVFSMNGLMRTRLSRDCSKMVLSTTAGYLIIIHNLNLATLESDLKNFKPYMYRLIQVNQSLMSPESDFTHLFRGPGRRNRVEFICDFPKDNEAEVVASISIHPDNVCVLSRNTNADEDSEWTCVHSIEEDLNLESDDDEDNLAPWSDIGTKSTPPTFVMRHEAEGEPTGEREYVSASDVWEGTATIRDVRYRRLAERSNGHLHHSPPEHQPRPRDRQMEWTNSANLRMRYEPNETARLQSGPSSRSALNGDVPPRGHHLVIPVNMFRPADCDGTQGTSLRRYNVASLRISSCDEDADASVPNSKTAVKRNIHKNIRRLTHFCKEPNSGIGYIKEPCFSPDGRVICSPYKKGVRLLAFNPFILQPWQCFPVTPPIELHRLKVHPVGKAYDDTVVSSKFSPLDKQLAVGCLSGKITIFNPFQ